MPALALVAVGMALVLFIAIAAVVLFFEVLQRGGECEFKAKALSLAVELRVSTDKGPGIDTPPHSGNGN